MNKRHAAIADGQVTYRSGKPCRKGHDAERYSSTGQCVECLKDQATKTKSVARDARARRFIALANSGVECKLIIPLQYRTALNEFSDIINNQALADTLVAFMLMLNRQTLDRADLAQLLTVDERGHVTNYGDYTVRNNDAGLIEIELRGHWYIGDDVMACLRGQRDSVERVV